MQPPTDPLAYLEDAALWVQALLPHLEVRIGWHEDGAVYLIELSDDSAVKEGLLDNLYMQFLNELEAMGSPFHVSFGHLNNKYLRLENPTKTFPALAQAA